MLGRGDGDMGGLKAVGDGCRQLAAELAGADGVAAIKPGLLDTVQCGDATELLGRLPDGSADLVVTSPPYYKQRAYNGKGSGIGHEASPELYLEALMPTFAECVRVVKPTGSIVYNLGDKYLNSSLLLLPYRFAIMATERFGLVLVNEITWVKRNPTPRQYTRRLVSSTEPFFHFAVGNDYYYDRKGFCAAEDEGKPHRPSQNLGGRYRTLIDESTQLSETQKRLAHLELDEVIDEVHSGSLHSFRMKIKGVHAEAFGGQEGGRKGQMQRNGFNIIRIRGEKMKRDVIESCVESLPGNAHTAIFPAAIIRELIRLLCPPNGLVIDPYMGSGTTAVAALTEGRHFFGTDLDASYCAAAQQRIDAQLGDVRLAS